jgi:Rieske 2Fe-2S family protein
LTRFLPISATECEVQYAWIVRSDAVEGKDYDLARLTELWRITGMQDKKICEDNQRGVNSRKYQPGPYSSPEQSVSDFGRWYLDAMK